MDYSTIDASSALLSWVQKDTRLTVKVKDGRGKHGGELCGPCPFCGGRDRFVVWPNEDPPGWYCRVCEQGGDPIDYLRRRYHLDFKTARDWLTGTPAPASRAPTQRRGQKLKSRSQEPPPADWQDRALRVVGECKAALWSDVGKRARVWLLGRGLREETLRAWDVGYHHADGEKGATLHGLWVYRGVVLPWFGGGHLWKVQIRRPASNPKNRYAQIGGAARACSGLYGADSLSGRADCFVLEGELDTLLLWQEAGDLVDVLTVGAKDGRLADRWLPMLLQAERFWIATDHDEGGEAAAAYWLQLTGERGQRILPPGGAKDVGDAWAEGHDLRTWAAAAVAEADDWETEAAELLAREPASAADWATWAAWARQYAAVMERGGVVPTGIPWAEYAASFEGAA